MLGRTIGTSNEAVVKTATVVPQHRPDIIPPIGHNGHHGMNGKVPRTEPTEPSENSWSDRPMEHQLTRAYPMLARPVVRSDDDQVVDDLSRYRFRTRVARIEAECCILGAKGRDHLRSVSARRRRGRCRLPEVSRNLTGSISGTAVPCLVRPNPATRQIGGPRAHLAAEGGRKKNHGPRTTVRHMAPIPHQPPSPLK